MGIRNIRTEGDEVLRKNAKPVKMITLRTKMLVRDMFDTMYDADGVGLAAPQVGILRRIVVIDCDGEHPYTFINPEILETAGLQTDYEGCLSIPGESAIVTRPNYVKVKALNEKGEEFVLEGTGLLARAILHETEHLDGILYVDKADSAPVSNADLAQMTDAQKQQAVGDAVEKHRAEYEAHAGENEKIKQMEEEAAEKEAAEKEAAETDGKQEDGEKPES